MTQAVKLDVDKLKPYTNDIGKIARAVESLIKTDGWQIFLAVWEKQKKEIMEKKDYETLEAFKADRGALDLFDQICDQFTKYITDAEEAEKLLTKTIREADGQTPRGILMIDALEEYAQEG